MSTYIDGIGSSAALDTAGEVVDLNGLDCSSLMGGALNWEHKSDNPNQIIGKIIKFKKIFSEKDCDDERQTYFWNKCKIPYLYVLGRLFDDKKDSAKEAAALFLDDMQHPDEHPMVGFSVEGMKIEKKGAVITRSIARKITVTNCPANKTCLAEMVPSTDKKPKDDFDNIFKTETFFEIELIKSDKPKLKKDLGGGLSAGGASTALSGGAPMGGGMTNSEKDTGNMKKATPKLSVVNSPNASKPHEKGRKIGRTSAGQDVWSHGPVNAYSHFGSDQHAEASNIHQKVSDSSNNLKIKQHHHDKARLHGAASRSIEANDRTRSERKKKAFKKAEQEVNEIGTNIAKEKMQKATGNKKVDRAINQSSDNSKALSMTKAGGGGGGGGAGAGGGGGAAGGAGGAGAAGGAGNGGAAIGGSMMGIGDPFRRKKSRLMMISEANNKDIAKGLDAGSMNAAPGQLQGGAVLGSESLSRKKQAVTKKPKSKWLARAEEEYAKWEKREEFETFMAKRMPHMAKYEIQAIGKTLALSKSLRAEKALAKVGAQNYQHSYVDKAEMEKALKFDFKHSGTPPKEDATPKPTPKKFHDYKANVSGHTETEIEHVQPHYDGKSADTLYTKAGHKLEGHAKGKFKVGDKVSLKPHISGTHILEHKK